MNSEIIKRKKSKNIALYDRDDMLNDMLDFIRSKRIGLTNYEIICYACSLVLLEVEAGERLKQNYKIGVLPKRIKQNANTPRI